MKHLSFIGNFIFAFLLIVLVQPPAMAYVGPGAGIAALGAFLAIIAAIVVAILGFLWYPIKRVLGKRKVRSENREEERV